MDDPTILNRRSGKVALSEAGEGAYIQFDVNAFEQLESAYGEDYINVIIKGLAKMKMSVYQKVIACTLKGSTNGNIPYDMLWEQLNIRILDAINLAIYGRTTEEQQNYNDELLMKRMEGVEDNPRLAAALSLMSATTREPDAG